MNAAQVTAALGLLRKTMPDLSQVSGSIDHRHSVEEMSDADLTHIAASSGARALTATDSPEEPDQFH